MKTDKTAFFPGMSGRFSLRMIPMYVLPATMLFVQVMVILFSLQIGIFPETEDWKGIVGTFAEIIAGLYGITAAGYTFFLSRIDALMASDGTLEYVVGSIKRRSKWLLWYITANVLMTLLTSIVLLYCPIPEGENMGFFYRLFCNEFLVFLVFSIALILIYSLLVIDPNAIPKEAQKLKKRMSNSKLPGDAVEFIRLYRRIREICDGLLPEEVLDQLHGSKGAPFKLTLQLLEEQKLLPRLLIHDVSRIHCYYCCVVNASAITVSQDMCFLAGKVLSFLETAVPRKGKPPLINGE